MINIADATNIERNLYLTLQLLEMGLPTVLALNMMDEVTGNGGQIDTAGLSRLLGIPVVAISAAKDQNVDRLAQAMIATAQAGKAPSLPDYFPEPLRRCRHEIAGILRAGTNGQGLPVDFCTSKIIEQDQEMVARAVFAGAGGTGY